MSFLTPAPAGEGVRTMSNHTTEGPHSLDNLSLVDVSDQCDPSRSLVRNLSVGDRVQLVMSHKGREGFLVRAEITEIEGNWPNRMFLGDGEPYAAQDKLLAHWDGVVAFRPRHVFAAWPQPAEGWQDTRDILQTAIVHAVAEQVADGAVQRAAVLGALESAVRDMLRDPEDFLVWVERVVWSKQ